MTARLAFVVGGVALVGMMLTSTPVLGQSQKPPRMTGEEVIALLDSARTPADHERLAAYYEEEAEEFEAKAAKHKAMAAAYRRMPAPGNPRIQRPANLAGHCDNIAEEATKAAKEARTMAEHHRMVAKESAGR